MSKCIYKKLICKFGWLHAISIVESELDSIDVSFKYDGDDISEVILISELKKYTDAYELVQSKGGIEKAKAIVADSFIWCSGGRVYANPLEQAITLIEEVGWCDE